MHKNFSFEIRFMSQRYIISFKFQTKINNFCTIYGKL